MEAKNFKKREREENDSDFVYIPRSPRPKREGEEKLFKKWTKEENLKYV